ncbi:MAG: class I SAM-dependent methyltransferase [Chloroflexota bacterium]
MKPKDFYEKMYSQHHPAPAGAASGVWRRLELGREEAAARMLDGGDRFLDVGCGEGNLVFLMAEKYKQVYGLDISEARIERARERAKNLDGERAHFQAADVSEGIPFGDGYFDAVSSIAVLEHVFDPLGLLREIRRVLRTGGHLIVVMPNVAYLPRRLSVLAGRPPKTSAAPGYMDGGTLHYFTLASLASLLKQADLVIMEKGAAGKLWFLRRWWVSLLSGSLVTKAVKS